MKFRLTILVFLLSLALAACSLAEDITPPASYSSPTSVPTIVPATQTPAPPSAATPTPTSESVATAAESTPAATDSTTPSAEVSPTAQADVVVIDGTVTLASGASIPDGTIATLLVYNTTAGQIAQTLTTRILPDGKYEFTNIPADTTTAYWVTVEYSSVTYESVPVQFDGTLFLFDMPITVYDTTDDLNVLTITQSHLQFDFSTAGQVQIMALYVISNPGGKSVVVSSDGTSVPFIQIPEGAESVNYQLAQSSSPLLTAANGFALLPGANMQYGIITTFTLPYTSRLVFTQPFSLPVSSATIIVPEGVKVRSDQLTDGGTQASTDTTYHLYQASSLASGSTLTLTISGMPGDAAGFVLDQRTWLMIGVGALGLILIGLGVFLFLRDRKLRKLEEEFEGADKEGDEDALGDDRENIMDAIIALDDQYKAGDISKEAYEKRRDELKDRLKNLA
ncbi:MAG: hypothetical protein NTW99_12620 [Chloroflexi bacterium]|nr:hypothetical protein [Chloroflexota bacterium]